MLGQCPISPILRGILWDTCKIFLPILFKPEIYKGWEKAVREKVLLCLSFTIKTELIRKHGANEKTQLSQM